MAEFVCHKKATSQKGIEQPKMSEKCDSFTTSLLDKQVAMLIIN